MLKGICDVIGLKPLCFDFQNGVNIRSFLYNYNKELSLFRAFCFQFYSFSFFQNAKLLTFGRRIEFTTAYVSLLESGEEVCCSGLYISGDTQCSATTDPT